MKRKRLTKKKLQDEEHIEGYTRREILRAKKARRLYHILTAPDIAELKIFLRQNIMRNCPVEVDDANLADAIFGKDVPTLKGKSTRPKTKQIKNVKIELPEELELRDKELELAMDVMFIDKSSFLVTIDRSIKYRAAVGIKDRSADELFESLDIILRMYNDAGYDIKTIYCDGEFRGILDRVSDELNITMVYAPVGDHVPDIERSNRVVQERYRVAFYRLPFARIPKLMTERLTYRVNKNLNLFPAKEGISRYYSPHTIL